MQSSLIVRFILVVTEKFLLENSLYNFIFRLHFKTRYFIDFLINCVLIYTSFLKFFYIAFIATRWSSG